jgi:hypothetical protein
MCFGHTTRSEFRIQTFLSGFRRHLQLVASIILLELQEFLEEVRGIS